MSAMKLCLFSFIACLLMMGARAASNESAVFQLRLVATVDPKSPEAGNYERVELTHWNRASGQTNREVLYLEKAVSLTEKDLKSTAVVKNSTTAQPEIAFTTTKQGQKHFAQVTRDNIGKRLAIVIDGKVVSAPVIRTEIPSGKGIVSGNFTDQEARNLSQKINDALKK